MSIPIPLKYLVICSAALLTTALCFITMQLLISGRIARPAETRPFALVTPVIPAAKRTDAPEARKQPQRVMPARLPPTPDNDPIALDNMETSTLSTLPNLGSTAKTLLQEAQRFQLNPPMRDLEPLYVVQPTYPFKAVMQEIEGYVIVQFGVRDNGTVVNPSVIASAPGSLFNEAALSAINEFRFRPRQIDGVPVAVPVVQLKFVFKLNAGDGSVSVSTGDFAPETAIRGT